MNEGDESCARCGDVGPDLRTLWMACGYAMHEFPVPFKQVAIVGRLAKYEGERDTSMGRVPAFAEPDGEERRRPFYTLRVCKSCRASWLEAITAWFKSGGLARPSPGTGIFVRRHGVNVELTEEEAASHFAARGVG